MSSGRNSVSAWGAASEDGLGSLVRLEGRFIVSAYQDLIETVLLSYVLDGPSCDSLFNFEQDCTHLLEHSALMTLEWPPKRPT